MRRRSPGVWAGRRAWLFQVRDSGETGCPILMRSFTFRSLAVEVGKG